jgi:serine-type D-Ala-D-Ala carboxypeptidase/endopeptidase (penicillin-binding protein 4)
MSLRSGISGVLASLLAFSLLSMPDAEARHRVSHVVTAKHHSRSASHVAHSKNGRQVAKASKRQRRKHERVARVARVRPRQEIGALVLSESGETVLDQMSAMEMNPASAVKIITSYGALSNFGPDYRFTTSLYLDGTIDPGTGIFQGDLYVKGNDPEFDHKDAAELAGELTSAGIKQIDGKLIVDPSFSYRSCPNPLASAKSLLKIWKGGANRVSVRNGAAVGPVVEIAQSAGQVESETLRETLKRMMSYSQNSVAEQIGRTVGGVRRLEEIVSNEAGLAPGAMKLASASGLGQSRVKPKDMMLILKSLRTKLQASGLDYQDIFPVAGIDPGTLDKRFTDISERGSVVAKTGTLPGTDGGTSALVGMFRCQKEDLYFVFFCWKGSVSSFRHQQDNMIRQIQAKRGGPKAIPYNRQQPNGDT